MARKNNYSFLGGVDERDAKTMISKLKAQDKRLTKKIGGKRAKYKIAPRWTQLKSQPLSNLLLTEALAPTRPPLPIRCCLTCPAP